MPPWHPFLHHFTIVFQLQEIIKAIYAADAANGSFYYKSVFHPGGLRAMPDPHSRYSKMVTLVSGETVTHANFWVRRTQQLFPTTTLRRGQLAPTARELFLSPFFVYRNSRLPCRFKPKYGFLYRRTCQWRSGYARVKGANDRNWTGLPQDQGPA